MKIGISTKKQIFTKGKFVFPPKNQFLLKENWFLDPEPDLQFFNVLTHIKKLLNKTVKNIYIFNTHLTKIRSTHIQVQVLAI